MERGLGGLAERVTVTIRYKDRIGMKYSSNVVAVCIGPAGHAYNISVLPARQL